MVFSLSFNTSPSLNTASASSNWALFLLAGGGGTLGWFSGIFWCGFGNFWGVVGGCLLLVDFEIPLWVSKTSFPSTLTKSFWPACGWGFFFWVLVSFFRVFVVNLGIFRGAGGSGVLFLFGVAQFWGVLQFGVVGSFLIVEFLAFGVCGILQT